MKLLFACLCAAAIAAGQEPPGRTPISAAELGIELQGPSREVAFTNKEAGVFYTETSGQHRSSWQGWRIGSRKVLDDYTIELDGRELSRSGVVRAIVYPHQFVREYSNGVRETVTMLDSSDVIVVQLDSVHSNNAAIRPLYGDLHNPEDFTLKASLGALMIGRNDPPAGPHPESYARWIAVAIMPSTDFALSFYEGKQFGKYYSPAAFRSGVRNDRYAFVMGAGTDSLGAARKVAKYVLSWYIVDRTQTKKERIEGMLNQSYIRTDDPLLDKALGWAKVSLDALIMNQRKKGIFAGLPWFDDYWGRDSFISLAGATLVTGNFADAREILRSFAEWQDTLPSSSTYGRIPNTVTTGSISYNSADGTPRFTMALGAYVRYSGDTAFGAGMYPVVKRSIEGTLQSHVDGNYFLTHGDADTWMDAAGSNGAWSPRGNRADDVQGLWYDQLGEGVELARRMNGGAGDQPSIRRWTGIMDTLSANFNRQFLAPDRGMVYDHLRKDGTPDRSMRPNQLFDARLIQDPASRRRMFDTVTKSLVYAHGVATLSQEDENFHPYHINSPYYVPDEAYHNGIVWPWLAGQWIDLAAGYGLQDTAFEVTTRMAHLILGRGAVGTLPELIDAAPRPGQSEPDLSGAYSQAWSLAEFIRSFYQSYLGVAVDAPRSTLTLSPRLPSQLGRADFNAAVGATTVSVAYERHAGDFRITLSSPSRSRPLEIHIVSPPEFGSPIAGASVKGTPDDGLVLPEARVRLAPGTTIRVVIDKSGMNIERENKSDRLPATDTVLIPEPRSFAGLKLAVPHVAPNLKALRPPPYRILTGDEIKATASANTIIYNASDPEGDDKGPGTYTYPQTPYLKPGSLDLVHFTVSTGQHDAHFLLRFKNLSDPGWHPEYGFQLTYAAIAIDKGEKPGSGERTVGMNAQYTFKPGFAFEDIIYVGGGVQVRDSRGEVIAQYTPSPGDAGNPLGNSSTKTVEFSIPLEVLGTPQPGWRFAVLVGAQDDHGGAGIGEFRNVESNAGEWTGGGKKRPDGSNIYDELLPKKSR